MGRIRSSRSCNALLPPSRAAEREKRRRCFNACHCARLLLLPSVINGRPINPTGRALEATFNAPAREREKEASFSILTAVPCISSCHPFSIFILLPRYLWHWRYLGIHRQIRRCVIFVQSSREKKDERIILSSEVLPADAETSLNWHAWSNIIRFVFNGPTMSRIGSSSRDYYGSPC